MVNAWRIPGKLLFLRAYWEAEEAGLYSGGSSSSRRDRCICQQVAKAGRGKQQLFSQTSFYVGCSQKVLPTVGDDLSCSAKTSCKCKCFHRLPRDQSKLMPYLTKLTTKFNHHKGLVGLEENVPRPDKVARGASVLSSLVVSDGENRQK